MEFPEILKIGGMHSYSQKGIEKLTKEEPPVSKIDSNITNIIFDYLPLPCEIWRDTALTINLVYTLNLDTTLEKTLWVGANVLGYVVGSYFYKYTFDKSLDSIKKERGQIIEERRRKIN